MHYRPGWDCHGLPIELKVLQEDDNETLDKSDPLSVRRRARQFATATAEEQKLEFESWGVMADWDEPYLTCSEDSVSRQIRLFKDMHDKGLVVRRYMPVYWSPSSRSSLAESELEYKEDHASTSAHVRFPVTTKSEKLSEICGERDAYLVAWTTTPWSIVANKAICYNKEADYSVVERDGDAYIVATKLLHDSELSEIFNDSANTTLGQIKGSDLNGTSYQHPLDRKNDSMPVLHADHVTLSMGTGLVHTAPAHGQDDYLVGLREDLDLSCCVDCDGKYTLDAGDELSGLEVLDEGSAKVLDMLKIRGHLLKCGEMKHSYPYDWRTKKPVILRASKQWFIDVGKLKEKALEELDRVSITPQSAKPGFLSILHNRPYW